MDLQKSSLRTLTFPLGAYQVASRPVDLREVVHGYSLHFACFRERSEQIEFDHSGTFYSSISSLVPVICFGVYRHRNIWLPERATIAGFDLRVEVN